MQVNSLDPVSLCSGFCHFSLIPRLDLFFSLSLVQNTVKELSKGEAF